MVPVARDLYRDRLGSIEEIVNRLQRAVARVLLVVVVASAHATTGGE